MKTSLTHGVNPQWQPILEKALECIDDNYVTYLQTNQNWLPGLSNLFAAFTQSLDNTRFILLGESPYPRKASANGYAFWDAAVHALWSDSGLSKTVNRATSLRNFIKMLLIARGDLKKDTSQEAIAQLDKSAYCQTGKEFFTNLLQAGFLLLNASLVYSDNKVPWHAKHWQPFMASVFQQLSVHKPNLTCVLFGRVASLIPETRLFPCITAEHPYNVSFITNPTVLHFFAPFDLLFARNTICEAC